MAKIDLSFRWAKISGALKRSLVIGFVFCLLAYSAGKSHILDFGAYWSAAKLFTSNPYDGAAVGALQQQQIAIPHDALIMRNPPWTALPFLPLALLPYQAAYFAWICLTAALLITSCRYFSDRSLLMLAAFLPAAMLLVLGQVVALMVASLALFLWFVDRQQYAYAGAALFVLTIKPHLTGLVLLAVFIWAIRTKRWPLFAGFAATATLAISLCLVLNPHIFSQYIAAVDSVIAQHKLYPSLPDFLVRQTGSTALRFVPLAIGLLSLIWIDEIALLLAIGVVVSPYSYIYDQVLLLPLLLKCFEGLPKYALAVIPVTSIGMLALHNYSEENSWWWTASAWLLVALIARSIRKSKEYAPAKPAVPICPSVPFEPPPAPLP